eukprot:2553512-Prymnesium_polylepis.1
MSSGARCTRQGALLGAPSFFNRGRRISVPFLQRTAESAAFAVWCEGAEWEVRISRKMPYIVAILRGRGPAVGTCRSDLFCGQIRGTPRLRTSDE